MPKENISIVEKNTKCVCTWLGWTQDDHSLFLYNAGIAYLERLYNNDEVIISYLSGRAMFWNWWKNLWQKRDEAMCDELFLNVTYNDGIAIHLRREIYTQIHDVKTLCSEIIPNRVVLGEQFAYLKQLV